MTTHHPLDKAENEITDEIVGGISVAILLGLIFLLIYWANCIYSNRNSTEEIGKILKPVLAVKPAEGIAARRKQFLELTSLESRKITPIPEGDEENSDDERDFMDEYYRHHLHRHKNDGNDSPSISLDSQTFQSEECREVIYLRKRSLGKYASFYILTEGLAFHSSTPRKSHQWSHLKVSPPVVAKVLPPHDIHEPPDIELPDETFYSQF